MDLPTSPMTPLGPMTRARTRAIEDKVNSLLSELPLSTYETWLLPQAETLCVIRYLEVGHGTTTPNGQDGLDTKYKEREEQQPGSLQPSDGRPRPDARRLKFPPAGQGRARECYSGRVRSSSDD